MTSKHWKRLFVASALIAAGYIMVGYYSATLPTWEQGAIIGGATLALVVGAMVLAWHGK